jgi:hydrogenase maturation factor
MFNYSQRFQVLDEDEAMRTLAAYERNYASNRITQVHYQVEFNEAKRIVDALPVDEAKKTAEKAINRKFKCVECYYRSNYLMCVTRHSRMAHPQVVFSRSQSFQVLDDDEATRTLAAYEKNFVKQKNFACKPYKCGICEHRSLQISNAYTHMRQVHQVEFYEAYRLVEVLPLDEAEKTVGDYNKKFVLGKYGSRGKFRSEHGSH